MRGADSGSLEGNDASLAGGAWVAGRATFGGATSFAPHPPDPMHTPTHTTRDDKERSFRMARWTERARFPSTGATRERSDLGASANAARGAGDGRRAGGDGAVQEADEKRVQRCRRITGDR